MKKFRSLYDTWTDGKVFGYTTTKLKILNFTCGWWFDKRFAVESVTRQLTSQYRLHKEYKNKYHKLHAEHNKHLSYFGDLPNIDQNQEV